MAFEDLFKSKKQRDDEAEKRKRRRKIAAERMAERAVDNVKSILSDLEKERDKHWEEARKYLKSGQKSSAQRMLQSFQNKEMMIATVDTKCRVFENRLTRLRLAETDQEFVRVLLAMGDTVEIDPEKVSETLDSTDEKLSEEDSIGKIWEDAYKRDMRAVERQNPDSVPSMEEMEKTLADEVAAEIAGPSPTKAKAAEGPDRIGEGRERIRKLLDGEK